MLRFSSSRAIVRASWIVSIAAIACLFGTHSPAARAAGAETFPYIFTGSDSDGAYPYGAVIEDASGSLYGTTSEGGANDAGTVYKIDSSGNFTDLYDFSYDSGYQPEAALTLGPDGSLYGTTAFGGSQDDGVVFKVDPLGNYTVLHAFQGGLDGGMPCAAVTIGNDGKLYGATTGDEAEQGSTSADLGTLFSLNTDGSGYLVQYRFSGVNGASVGEQPDEALVPAFGLSPVLYGATYSGGAANSGTVFAFTPGTTDGSGTVQVLYTFGSGLTGDGQNPGLGRLQLDATNNLYGTTENGGLYGGGTVYEVAASGTETVLHSFAADSVTEGESPDGGVLLASDGNLYGSTTDGGLGAFPGDGTLYSISPSGSGFTTLYGFQGSTLSGNYTSGDGMSPYACPLEDASGNLLGTTMEGGDFSDSALGYGVVYKIAAAVPNIIVPSSVVLAPSTVTSGMSSTGTVTLTLPAPAGGAVVSLSSSQPSAAAPQSTVTIPAGAFSAQFTVATSAVSSATAVTIIAAYNNAGASATLTVMPSMASSVLKSVVLSPNSTQGGTAATTANRVYWTGNAPASEIVILKSSNTAAATVPSSVTISSGSSSHVFTITSKAVTTAQTVTITATCAGVTQTATLTVTPPPSVLKSVVLSPTSTEGGSAATTANRVYWTGNAPSDETVTLTSSNTAVATVPSTVKISSGSSSHVFTITTKKVTSQQTVTITATSGGISQTATLTVTP